jgi:Ca2+-binding RTX toxin-like protein
MSQPKSRPMMESMESRRLMSVTLADVAYTGATTIYVEPAWSPTTMVNGNITAQGTVYDDRIYVWQENSTTIGINNNGHYSYWYAPSVNHIYVNGGDGGDHLIVYEGMTKNVTLRGDNGGDILQGGNGNDNVYGGEGFDDCSGGWGNDNIDGGNHADWLSGEGGDDVVSGGLGDDTGYGGAGNDWIYGGSENDRLDGGDGTDNMYGGWGNDNMTGGNGTDWMYGEQGNDVLTGGASTDYLRGGDGDDYFYASGDGANDSIDGGLGYDTARVDKRSWWEPWANQDSWSNVENAFEP